MADKKFHVDYSKRTPGEVIRARRTELGWSQLELSLQSGISVPQIGRIERNAVNPKVKTIKQLEGTLGIDLFPLFDDEHDHEYRPLEGIANDIVKIISTQKLSKNELDLLFEIIIAKYPQK